MSPARRGLSVTLLGALTLLFSALYLTSDGIELVTNGLSTSQLRLTFVGEAAVPAFVVGHALAPRRSL